jgi:hypothetical protein
MTSAYPASWYPDPYGRSELRYWDGSAWTAHVSRHGIIGVDPVASPAATTPATATPATATPAPAMPITTTSATTTSATATQTRRDPTGSARPDPAPRRRSRTLVVAVCTAAAVVALIVGAAAIRSSSESGSAQVQHAGDATIRIVHCGAADESVARASVTGMEDLGVYKAVFEFSRDGEVVGTSTRTIVGGVRGDGSGKTVDVFGLDDGRRAAPVLSPGSYDCAIRSFEAGL